ncbi:Transposase DDE domain protein (plasmid) [Bacillus cereus]|nr:Transposase DDE domain protein [Bacillus cereus]
MLDLYSEQVLAKLLNRKSSSSRLFSSPYTSIFKSICILDSTAFQLPDVFSSVYPDAGGCSHKTGIKIQLEYDLLNGQFLHIHTRPGKQHDRTYGSLYVPMGQLHDWYSLRWKIEIIFKTWKSFFQIHHFKKIKPEQLEYHLYGQLIAILLYSSIMFQMRQLLLMKKKRGLSEYKAI